MGNQYWKNAISGRYICQMNRVHSNILYTQDVTNERASEQAKETNNENPQLYFFCTMREHVMVIDCQAKLLYIFIWSVQHQVQYHCLV